MLDHTRLLGGHAVNLVYDNVDDIPRPRNWCNTSKDN